MEKDPNAESDQAKIEPQPTDNRFMAFVKSWPMHIVTVILLLAVVAIAPQQLGVLVFKACVIFLSGTMAYWLGRANGLTDDWQRIALICAAMVATALAL